MFKVLLSLLLSNQSAKVFFLWNLLNKRKKELWQIKIFCSKTVASFLVNIWTDFYFGCFATRKKLIFIQSKILDAFCGMLDNFPSLSILCRNKSVFFSSPKNVESAIKRKRWPGTWEWYGLSTLNSVSTENESKASIKYNNWDCNWNWNPLNTCKSPNWRKTAVY